MNGNSNKIVVIVAVFLVVVMLTLLIGAGSCSGSGGGAAVVDAPDGGGASSGDASISSTATTSDAQGFSPSNGYEDTTVDELRAMINDDHAPVGSNARDAATSSSAISAAEAFGSLDERGFGDVEVSADFDVNGTYIETRAVDGASDDRYPSYQAYYASEQGVAWLVYINDGNYIATPLGSEKSALPNRIVLSESDYVTQYDGDRNEYSEFALDSLPNAVGKRVARIDKPTLDSYSISDLEKMR